MFAGKMATKKTIKKIAVIDRVGAYNNPMAIRISNTPEKER
jgi:hypothetical protein